MLGLCFVIKCLILADDAACGQAQAEGVDIQREIRTSVCRPLVFPCRSFHDIRPLVLSAHYTLVVHF